MLTVLVVLTVIALPALALAGVLAVATAVQRVRADAVARQIELTDAIHAELGAVAAPVVEKPAFGPWRVTLAVPFNRPALVEQLVVITDRVLAPARPAGLRIIFTPRADVPRPRAA